MDSIKREIAVGSFQYHKHFANSPRPVTSTTFRDYSTQWLAALRKSKSTMSSYRAAVNFWCDHFGAEVLGDIRYSQIAAAMKSPRSGKTLNNYLVALRGVFDLAVRDKLLTDNPAEGIKNVPVQPPEPDPLELHEAELIISHMYAKYPEPAAAFFEFAFFTGLRTSELFALTWDDIDWRRNTVRVNKAFVEGELKVTKTSRIRYVDLNSRALTALTRQKKHTFLAGEHVFLYPVTGKPYSGDQMPRRTYWIPTLKALGIRARDAYTTRHTYCTLLLMQGVAIGYVSGQMGHSTPKMTWERYFKWIPGAQNRVELDKLEAVIGQNLGREVAK